MPYGSVRDGKTGRVATIFTKVAGGDSLTLCQLVLEKSLSLITFNHKENKYETQI